MQPREIDVNHPPRIRFGGRELPPAASFLDVAAACPESDPELSEWWWAFSICVGRTREADAEEMLDHAASLMALIERRPSGMLSKMELGLASWSRETLFSQWLQSLQVIIEVASAGGTCVWAAS